ncbi:MAG TPA: hypothetical protein PKX92_13630 [Edaphocola sp.]|nr:hypothetical protein [Edaphocola sp.]
MNPHSSHTHCQVAQADTQAKTWQRVCLPHPEKIELKKFSLPSENKKYAIAQLDTTKKETAILNKDKGLQTRKTEGLLLTAVWRNGGGRGKLNSSFSNQHLCLVDSEVLRNPPLRQAAKRWLQA